MKTLEVLKLNKKYLEKTIFKDVDLEIGLGEVVSIIGPSGEGKSTLLKCIAGLEDPTSGSININGRVGMVFQQFNLFQNLTVIENISLPLRIVKKFSKKEAKDLADEVLDKVGLKEISESFPSGISGGQAQRAAIARTIALDPQLILFDEPTSSLDPYLKKEVLNLIRSIATDKQRSIMLVTHEIEFAKTISDSIYTLSSGSLSNNNKTII